MKNYYGKIFLPIALLAITLSTFQSQSMDTMDLLEDAYSTKPKAQGDSRKFGDSSRSSGFELFSPIPDDTSSGLLQGIRKDNKAISNYSKSSKGKPLDTLPYDGFVTTVAFSPHKKYILIGCNNGKAFLRDLDPEHSDNELAFGSSDGGKKALFQSFAEKRSIKQLEQHDEPITVVAFSPDSTIALTASEDSTVCLWDLVETGSYKKLKGHKGSIISVAFSPDSKLLLTGSTDKTARLWDALTGQQLKVLRGHTGPVASVEWGPRGKNIIIVSDTQIYVWDNSTDEDSTLSIPIVDNEDESSEECCSSCNSSCCACCCSCSVQ